MKKAAELQAAFGDRLQKLNNGELGLCGGIHPRIRAHAEITGLKQLLRR